MPSTLGIVASAFFVSPYDSDAQDYITRVETADGQALETGVTDAINAFVVGCKADGIWTAIKASAILSGARTLSGALQPLVGTAPTNFNFVSDDYNRSTGLLGNGSTKYLNSNRNTNEDPLNNFHLSAYQSSTAPAQFIVCGSNMTGPTGTSTLIFSNPSSTIITGRSRTTVSRSISALSAPSLIGQSRASSSSWVLRGGGTSETFTEASTANANLLPLFVFGQNLVGSVASHSNTRIAFYSIGESINLALLDARVTTLINAYGAI